MTKDTNHTQWFEEFKKSYEYAKFVQNPVAYFCAEYALEPSMPTYAGGLGVLAGDHVREAAEREFPMLSVGLFYQKAQNVLSPEKNYSKGKLEIVKNKNGGELLVSLPFEGRMVYARAWSWQQGKIKVYLLDTDIEKNEPQDREITKELYTENRDTRLRQEIMLGIGGFRLLSALGYHPSVYHLNEGHSAFLALELVRHEMEHQKVNFFEACEFAKKHIIFTNHTLVPAGQEQFASEKVAELIEHCALEICLNKHEIVKLGALEGDPGTYSMTNMSFRLSFKSNTVSKMHLEKAKTVWPQHAPNMENVTNGISVERWDKVKDETNEELLTSHLENKKKLLALVKEKTGKSWSEKDLIFVWARRMVSYKQPLLILDNIEKIKKLAEKSPVKIRILFSGPTGGGENPFVDALKGIAEEKLPEVVAFIPNYNTEVAEVLSAGADVWLNTPVPGNEACGTSGMKAGLNGALNLSTKDGWVGEVEEKDFGWIVNNGQSGEEMLTLIEKEIIPMFQKHQEQPDESEWIGRMRKSRDLIKSEFSSGRAFREYIEKMYLPALAQKHQHKID